MKTPIKHAAVKQGNIIYVGKRHFNCFAVMAECKIDVAGAEQGFVDGAGIFYDRVTALKIAQKFGQVVDKLPPYDKLISEDIY